MGPVGAPHHIFALLAETAFLRAAGHLIPYHASSPDPPGPLQSVGNGRVLPPVDEQADRRSRPAGFPGVGQPLRHPSRPASLVPVIPVEIRQGILGVHAAVLLVGGAVFLRWLPSARSIGRIGDEGVEHLRFECPDDLQGIPMQDGPAIPAAMLQRQNGFVYDLCELFRFVQRHHPFVVWLSLPVGAFFLLFRHDKAFRLLRLTKPHERTGIFAGIDFQRFSAVVFQFFSRRQFIETGDLHISYHGSVDDGVVFNDRRTMAGAGQDSWHPLGW